MKMQVCVCEYDQCQYPAHSHQTMHHHHAAAAAAVCRVTVSTVCVDDDDVCVTCVHCRAVAV